MSAIFYKNLPYGAGGSNVEANPSGSATEDLEKIGIDGTVYDVTDADAVHNSDKGVANGVASLDANGRVNETANYARTAGMANQGSFVFTPQNSDYDGSVGLIFTGTSQQYAPQELLQVPYKSGTLATTSDIKDGTLTIQKDGVDIETFTANSASNKTANITVAADIATAKNDLTVIAEKTDTDPYIYRPSVANGDRVREDIVGASVGWNQLATFASSIPSAVDGITYTASESNSVILSGTVSNTSQRSGWFNLDESSEFANRVGHKVLFFSRAISGTASKAIKIDLFTSTTPQHNIGDTFIKEVPQNYRRLYWSYESGCVFSNYRITFNCIDLTTLFGATIADHIYSLEQATAGAGVAFFRKYFSKSYYPYNAGELLSVEVEGKKYVGKNLINLANSEQGGIDGTGALVAGGNMWRGTEFIKVVPNKKVTFSALSGYVDSFRIYYYDQNKNYIGRELDTYTYTIPSDCAYIKWVIYHVAPYTFTQALVNSINLQLEYGENPTTYEPYHLTTYTFPSQTLRGLFTLVDGELKASGDVYGDDGVIKRKFKRYNMGGIEWGFSSTDQVFWTLGIESTKNLIACGYVFKDIADVTNNATAAQYLGNLECTYRHGSTNDRVYFKNSAYTDKSSFVAAMNDVYMDIELPTPTTEQAEPLVMPQICEKNGTEEFVTTSIVPVGHESTYYNYPDYMESGEYKDFRDRVDYAPEKAKWKKVGEYNTDGQDIVINGDYSEIMIVPFMGSSSRTAMNGVTYPFELFGTCALAFLWDYSEGNYQTDASILENKKLNGNHKIMVYVR